MNSTQRALTLALAAVLLAGGPVAAADKESAASKVKSPAAPKEPSLESRLQRLERLLDSDILMEMVSRMDALQEELRALRGDLEEQGHAVEGLKRRQRELYLDIDRRLSRIEREGGGAPARVEPATPETAAAFSPKPIKDPDSAENGTRAEDAVPDGTDQAGSAAPARRTETASPADIAAERKAYQQAFHLLRDLRYEPAIEAFQSFLKEYPDGRYAPIAQYWLGEANYARRDFKAAITSYQRLINNHPESPKVAEAMLKIGYSRYELEQRGEAREVLQELVRRYPDTTEAGQGRQLLQTMRQEAG